MDGEILRKSLSRTKYVRFAFGVIILVAIVTSVFKIGTDYLSFLEGREAYINREIIETTIYEESDSSLKETTE